jgi:hypothetical protein
VSGARAWSENTLMSFGTTLLIGKEGVSTTARTVADDWRRKIMEVKRTIKTYVKSFELGDVINFELKDGEKVQAKAVKQTDEGMLFITVDCLKDEYQMFKYPVGSMEINYFNSDLRHALNGEILDRFPEEIRRRMVGMRIGATDTFDLLRIPTEREIFGENPYGKEESDTVEQFKGMENRRNRIAFQGSETVKWECYWLQNRVKDFAYLFARVNGEGLVYYGSASYSVGVRPAFILS